MKIKALKPVLTLIILTAVMVLPYFVFAQTANTGTISADANPLQMLEKVGTGSPGAAGPYNTADENTLPKTIGTIVNAALSLLGIIFVVLIIYAGFNWMTASGNEESVSKAKKIITSAVIGLIIVLSAWGIWTFVLFEIIAKL
ncbi:MAG: pilin [bacterium]|nr:pilin [bacterium]